MKSKEPVLTRGVIAAFFQVLALVAGVTISPDLQNALTVLILAAVPVATLIAAALARRKVTPTAKDPSAR